MDAISQIIEFVCIFLVLVVVLYFEFTMIKRILHIFIRFSVSRTVLRVISFVLSMVVSIRYVFFENYRQYGSYMIDDLSYSGPATVFILAVWVFINSFLVTCVILIIICIFIFKSANSSNKSKEGNKPLTFDLIDFFDSEIIEKEVFIANSILFISLILSAISLFMFFSGGKNIDSQFSRDRYITTVTVNAFPENSESKNYRFQAEIRVDNGNILSVGEKEFTIIRIQLPNGGHLDCDSEDNSDFDSERLVYIEDQDGKEWTIEIPRQALF